MLPIWIVRKVLQKGIHVFARTHSVVSIVILACKCFELGVRFGKLPWLHSFEVWTGKECTCVSVCVCEDKRVCRELAAGFASAGCGVITDSFSLSLRDLFLPARWRHTQFNSSDSPSGFVVLFFLCFFFFADPTFRQPQGKNMLPYVTAFCFSGHLILEANLKTGSGATGRILETG